MARDTFEPKRDIPSLDGKVILVTGANAGIGKATIRALALHGPARIYLCARRRSAAETAAAETAAAETAAAELRAECRYDSISILNLDLASLDSVKTCAAEFNEKEGRLDLLFLNAGVASTAPAVTREGYEYQFGVNHVGHALLTQLLMPKMLHTKREDPNADVRIIATASNAAFAPFLPKGGLALDAMRRPDAYSPIGLYAHSKLANVLFIRKIAQTYPEVSAVAVHPGVVKSEIWGKGAGGLFSTLYRPVVWATSVNTDQGAKSQLWGAAAPRGGTNGVKTGQYYQPVGKMRTLKGAAADPKLADELWEWTNNELASHGGKGWPVM
jgi:NAD(P)-dependent dehydrogenase (short-subunit alcohol dehydrogenase family)